MNGLAFLDLFLKFSSINNYARNNNVLDARPGITIPEVLLIKRQAIQHMKSLPLLVTKDDPTKSILHYL